MHLFRNNVTAFLLLLSLLGIASFTSSQESPTFNGYYCPNNATFHSSAEFQNNLNLLISSVVSNASRVSDGAFLMNTGLGSASVVNGIYLCRGDVSLTICDGCVVAAAAEIQRRCRNQTESIVWYDECMLGYTNRYFDPVGIVPRKNSWDGGNVSTSDLDSFNRTLFGFLNDLAEEASSTQSGKKFATREQSFIGSSGKQKTLYGLAQCAPSLSNDQCKACLKSGIGTIPACCGGKQGGRALLAWCNVRYEPYQFYSTSKTTASPLPPPPPSGKKKSRPKTGVVIVVLVAVFIALFCLACYLLVRRRPRKARNTLLRQNFGDESYTLESLQFSLATIEAATNKFSYQNKIGRGGFGEVYKGILSNGQEIAVKKLSPSSGQGAFEFKNEILLIAKLQHRNLVTLLGFCLEEQEKMLIYEFVPNKSLDYFLFDPHKSHSLNWSERYKIIQGIARGILYLHEHSRLKVIHRDLKPSNILLDNNINPKISDFGLAKMVALDQDQGSTNRVVGTFGYMSPEYMKYGHFSEKSDVFSFGIIVLEVISAKRSGRPLESSEDDDLLSYIWRLYRDETPLQILDQDIKESCNQSEVIKCIQIGLLCVQQKPDDRPTIAKVVTYLSNPLAELPFPGEPTNFMQNNGIMQRMVAGESSSGSAFSVNEMSVSKFIPR